MLDKGGIRIAEAKGAYKKALTLNPQYVYECSKAINQIFDFPIFPIEQIHPEPTSVNIKVQEAIEQCTKAHSAMKANGVMFTTPIIFIKDFYVRSAAMAAAGAPYPDESGDESWDEWEDDGVLVTNLL